MKRKFWNWVRNVKYKSKMSKFTKKNKEHLDSMVIGQGHTIMAGGIANGNQGVLPAQRNAGEQNGNAVLHGGTLPFL